MLVTEPLVHVALLKASLESSLSLEGSYRLDDGPLLTGALTVRAEAGKIALEDASGYIFSRAGAFCLTPVDPANTFFTLTNVRIGIAFHWERTQMLSFRGSIVLSLNEDGSFRVINRIGLEDYLASVISSEMSADAPLEFLQAQAITARSWLMAMLDKKKVKREAPRPAPDEILTWQDVNDHEGFDVCADDHCQRYQGVGAVTEVAREAVAATRGRVLTWQGEVCDARYSKCCGGRTERFESAWEDVPVPYLVSVADGPASIPVVSTEEEAERWIRSEPEACCRVRDPDILKSVLPDFDRETPDFFRWRVEYNREELQAILEEKSGLDLGDLLDLVPLERGPSGRIVRLRVEGSRGTVVVGKELEIRRWLSRSHLYSSAFVVEKHGLPSGLPERFVLRGAGWGHGVGLCQIGAAALACRGFTAEEILARYFPGTSLTRLYD